MLWQIAKDWALHLVFFPIRFLATILPKAQKVWVFGEYAGRTFADSPKHLFEYLAAGHREIVPVWLTKSDSVLAAVRKRGHRAFHSFSPSGIYYAMRAAVAVCCVDLRSDLNPYVMSRRTLYVNLWHGTPLKKIGADVKTGRFAPGRLNFPGKDLVRPLLRFLGPRPWAIDLLVSASPDISQSLGTAFKLPAHRIVETGYPRNDALFRRPSKSANLPPAEIIYMPTFRNAVGSECELFDTYGFDLPVVESFLERNNARLLIRLHRYNRPRPELVDRIESSRYVAFHTHDDIYEDLPRFSVLITDYSSIYFDYLLLDRPIVFAPFDKEQYIARDRELYYEYDDVTPGPKANDWSQVLEHTGRMLAHPEWFAEERERLKRRFNQYCDGRSSERVFNAVANMLSAVPKE